MLGQWRFAPLIAAVPASLAWNQTAWVDLSHLTGTPTHLASGFINGVPFNYPNQIPDHFYTGIALNSTRNGGGQPVAPHRGYIFGVDEYKGLWELTVTNYQVCQEFGADFIIGPHGLWGNPYADGAPQEWPGDNGNWTLYDNFLTQIMDDIVASNATDKVNYDIWNEPNLSVFWNRTEQQWIDMYIRTHKAFRANPAMDSVLLSGPTLMGAPRTNDSYWINWMQQVKGNNTIPDQYVYHLESIEPENDPQYSHDSLNELLSTYDLPQRQVNINEYGLKTDIAPSGYVWWISRLERYNFIGLLGNYQNGLALDDLMANLLTKEGDPLDYNNTNYLPAAGYPVMSYYATNMTGQRVSTAGSIDLKMDSYATMDDTRVKILTAPRLTTGNYTLQILNVDCAGYSDGDMVSIEGWTYGGTNDIFTPAPEPQMLASMSLTSMGSTIDIPVYQTDNHTAWVFEFDVKK